MESVQQQLVAMENNQGLQHNLQRGPQRSSTTKVAKITLATSVLGIAVSGLHLYSLIGVYGLYSDVVHPSPWPWLAFHSIFRLVELVMACTITYSVMQPAEVASSS